MERVMSWTGRTDSASSSEMEQPEQLCPWSHSTGALPDASSSAAAANWGIALAPSPMTAHSLVLSSRKERRLKVFMLAPDYLMHGTGQTGIKRTDDPRGFNRILRVGNRQADQRLLHRARNSAIIARRAVPSRRHHALIIADFGIANVYPMSQRPARRFRQTVAAAGFGNGKIGERRFVWRGLVQPLRALVNNEFAFQRPSGVTAQNRIQIAGLAANFFQQGVHGACERGVLAVLTADRRAGQRADFHDLAVVARCLGPGISVHFVGRGFGFARIRTQARAG